MNVLLHVREAAPKLGRMEPSENGRPRHRAGRFLRATVVTAAVGLPILVTGPRSGARSPAGAGAGSPAGPRSGYALVYSRGSGVWAVDHDHTHNPAGDVVEVQREDEGRFRVRFRGLGGGAFGAGGHARATARGSAAVACHVVRWGSGGRDFTLGVRCADARGRLEDQPFAVWVWPTGAGGEGAGYVWVSRPGPPGYRAGGAYARNGGGGPIDVSWHREGKWTVRFGGLGGEPERSGHVQVGAYGPEPGSCRVVDWSTGPGRLEAGVACEDPGGQPDSRRYTVLAWGAGAAPAGAAYLLANRPRETEYEPRAATSRGFDGGRVRIRRASAGRFVVRVQGLAPGRLPYGPAQVTAHGGAPGECHLQGQWWREESLEIAVVCHTPRGLPDDRAFLLYLPAPGAPAPDPETEPVQVDSARRDSLAREAAAILREIDAYSVERPPDALVRFEYRGQTVYYVPPPCCDIMSRLYADDGELLCRPDGGLSGMGDGGCPDFFDRRTNRQPLPLPRRE